MLNKSYFPVKHVSWKKAFSMIIRDRAMVLEVYDEVIRTPNDFFFIPAVIRTTEYDGFPKTKVTFSKRAILERDKFICQYCSKKLNFKTATMDHVLPRSHGGKTTFENTVASCFRCNNKKGSRLNKQAGLKLNKKPVKPKFQHYKLFIGNSIRVEWVDYLPRRMLDGVQIIG